MLTFCSHCGANLSYGFPRAAFGLWNDRCADCGLATDREPATLAPGPDQTAHDLHELRPGDRILLRQEVARLELPWRWEDGLRLIVREQDGEVVEAILSDFTAE